MKLFFTMTALILSTNLYAGLFGITLNLHNTSQVNLSLDTNAVLLNIAHPGKEVSGVCSLEIVTSSRNRGEGFRNLTEELMVFGTSHTEVISGSILRIDLPVGRLGASVTLKVRNGNSLKDIIDKFLGNRGTLIVRTRSCD